MRQIGWAQGALALLLALPVVLAMRGSGDAGFPLDEAGGVGGLAFGQRATSVSGFKTEFRQQGRPRMDTRLYKRHQDTVQVAGLGHPASYWFRGGRFVGVDLSLPSRRATQALLVLTQRYGPAEVDSTRRGNEYYWLGKRSFIMLAPPVQGGNKDASYLMLGSLDLLNELIVETAVRAQARRRLGWQPDSVGLPRQFPSR